MAAPHEDNSDADSEEEEESRMTSNGREGEDNDNGKENTGINLTSFLFGNIDESGQLEEEFLDESTRKQLGSLGSMLTNTNLNNIVEEVKSDAIEGINENLSDDKETGDSTDFNEKAPDAEDFSCIDEMLPDDSSEDDSDEEEDRNEEKPKSPEAVVVSVEDSSPDKDALLMPPPPPQEKERTPVSDKQSEAKPSAGPIVAPLASMLPDKYKNVDVKEFFPEFKENSVLRFSKLFPIKESHKPRTWKALKKRRRKERGEEDEGEPREKVKRGWDYKVPMPTDPNAYEECQSVRYEFQSFFC